LSLAVLMTGSLMLPPFLAACQFNL
jgi:hypothetical protein